MKVKSLSLTLWDPMDCSPPGKSGIFQARVLEYLGCHFLFHGIFLTQGLNPGLPHCRQMLLPSEPPLLDSEQNQKLEIYDTSFLLKHNVSRCAFYFQALQRETKKKKSLKTKKLWWLVLKLICHSNTNQSTGLFLWTCYCKTLQKDAISGLDTGHTQMT